LIVATGDLAYGFALHLLFYTFHLFSILGWQRFCITPNKKTMTKALWIALALFVIGNALFVLPFHFSDDKVVTSYQTTYKKDSALIHAVFPDSPLCLELSLPTGYDGIYKSIDKKISPTGKQCMHVNATLTHNVGFMSLLFPFYKSTQFNSDISFYSIITIGDKPGSDSVALIGNIHVNGRLAVGGICSPLYARNLVEKSLMDILKKEMDGVQKKINE
jgi:hypothetical protein